MSFMEAMAVLKGGLTVAQAARDHLASPDKKDQRARNELCAALRALYFTPDGVISLLREIESGKRLSAARIQQALTDFNDREWKVKEALGALNFEQVARNLGVRLRDARQLHDIRDGKINIRREIQSEVNYYGQRNREPDRTRVRELISLIEQLSDEIEQIEGRVNTRAG